jgi:hypothetical protein
VALVFTPDAVAITIKSMWIARLDKKVAISNVATIQIAIFGPSATTCPDADVAVAVAAASTSGCQPRHGAERRSGSRATTAGRQRPAPHASTL